MRIGNINDLFINDAAQALYECWRALPREDNQICPKRFELNFANLPINFRQHAFILANHEKGILSATDIGTVVTSFLGERLDGQNLSERHGPSQMKYETPYYDAVYGQPCAGVLTRRTVNQQGTHANFVSCHLPLLDYKNEVRYLLGIVEITNVEAPELIGSPIIFDNSHITDRMLVDIGAGIPTSETQS